MIEQVLTCSFRLRPPTAKKRTLLTYTFRVYTDSVQELLDWAQAHLTDIGENGQLRSRDGKALGKYTAKSIAPHLPSSGQWDFDLPSCLKESAVVDAASMLASYLELRKLDTDTNLTAFPVAKRSVTDERAQALEGLRQLGLVSDWEDEQELIARENDLRNALLRKPRSTLRPLTFLRERDFAMLYDKAQQRMFLLVPVAGEHAKTHFSGNLINVNGGNPRTGSSSIGMLFPVELGMRHDEFFWQYQKFLRAALDGKANILSAKFIAGSDGYYINIAFAFFCPEPYELRNYLGLGKHLLRRLRMGIVDEKGKFIGTRDILTGIADLKREAGVTVAARQRKGLSVGRREYKSGRRKNNLHNLANYVIELALAYQAAIVVEEVSDPRFASSQKKNKWMLSPWREFVYILKYKCIMAGVPFAGERFSAKAYIICPHCGGKLDKVRGEPSVGKCAVCGTETKFADAASVNIARRVLYRKKEWEQKGGYLAFHQSFATEELVEKSA